MQERSAAASLVFLCAVTCASGTAAENLAVYPDGIHLSGPQATTQVVVVKNSAAGLPTDLTRNSKYLIADDNVAVVAESGIVEAKGDGHTRLLVVTDAGRREVSISVTGFDSPAPASFANAVIPALTKLGCNSGGCHGKAEGQNGFKLSVFGFEPEADFETLTRENRGRRVNRVVPATSLILGKATGRVPHGGGRRTDETSIHYRTLSRWLSEGATFEHEPVAVTSIEVQPEGATLSLDGQHQLRVIAHFSDASHRDVTHTSEFQSNADNLAAISRNGLIEAKGVPGEAAVLVRFLDQMAVCTVTIPRSGTEFKRPPENNFVDQHVWDKLERLGIQPSGLADDATFLRRVFLDTIGTLPTADETRSFLGSDDPTKRTRLIEQLLDRNEYSFYQSQKWADLLRLDGNALGSESSVAFNRWLRRQFRENRPYDEFVRDILTARGSTRAESPAALYVTLNEAKELGSSISQLFLGIRIECAECHHHPFEKWSQEDFYSFAGLFTGVGQKTLPGGAKGILVKAGSDLKHPKMASVVPARGLGEDISADAEFTMPVDRREHLADWMTSDTNPYFARAIVNRVWANYFSRGLIDPVDDLRASNPASNEAVLTALADHLRESDYDLKVLTQTILESRTYQLNSEQNDSNADDQQNFSRAAYRPHPAEVLLDAISQVTGVAEKFNGWPLGARAIEVWDNRMPSYFFRIFGRPTRTTVCACERGDAPSISQALHLLNSSEIGEKIQHRQGRVRQLADSELGPDAIIDELYLSTVNRFPTVAERDLMLQACAQNTDRRETVEDLMWTLLNTKEFLFNH
ncbi:MAG: DUF1549 and DUF1553 domain-containing protein [Fuerstiella sp.]|nr:DUF1549 and DUF1553 domain-containing protein [Fuerstiella sp.]